MQGNALSGQKEDDMEELITGVMDIPEQESSPDCPSLTLPEVEGTIDCCC